MSKNDAQKTEVIMETPKFLNTKWAAIAVYGWEMVTEKTLNIFSMLLNLPFWEDGDHGIRTIHIVDDRLYRWDYYDDVRVKPLAECWTQTGAVGIDLGHTLKRGVYRCQNDAPNASIYAWYLTNILVNLLHEAHHMACCRADARPDLKPLVEEEAEEFAHNSLMDVAKIYDIEPDEWTDDPFFRDTVLGDGLEEVEDDEWLKHQLHMLDNRLFFHLPESDKGEAVKCHTFKDYLHFVVSTDEPNDETWTGSPIPVAPIAKAAADVVPPTPVTEAVETMVEQADNVQPAEATPAENVIPLGPPAEPVVQPAPSVAAAIQQEYAAQEAVMAPEEEEPYYPDESEEDYEEPVQTPPPAANTTQFMNGMQVGNNVAPPPTNIASPEVNHYNPTSMDDQTLINVIQGLYFKCYNHIFSYCGPTPNGFSHPSKVYELRLELTPEEAEAVVAMDCLDENGRWCPRLPSKVQSIDGTITARLLGSETKKDKLPSYKLYINANGQEVCRFLLPQNPLKQNNGQFSKPALAAQSGSRIMYVFEGNDDIKRATGRSIIGKIVDGRWEA